MPLKLIFAALLLSFGFSVKAQNIRYKDSVFSEVTVKYNLNYADDGKDKKAHLYDLYTPTGDTKTKRPLVIWMHGGGFIFGSKDVYGVKLWSETFAKRGYVCANINYNLGSVFSLTSSGAFKHSTYDAVQDCRMAVAYFKANAEQLGIDPDKIILAGDSAGGIISLLTAYTTNYDLATKAGFHEGEKGVDFSKDRTRVAGIINFWGGMMSLQWLKNAKVPIVSCYGSDDGLVKPTSNEKGNFFGSVDIHKEADALKIPNAIKVFEGYSHELQKHFNPVFKVNEDTKQRWLQAGQFSADFIYKEVASRK